MVAGVDAGKVGRVQCEIDVGPEGFILFRVESAVLFAAREPCRVELGEIVGHSELEVLR
jgi:hypothetical protein